MKDRILQIMRSEGMTQQEFSRATGLSPASLSSIFNGRTAPTMKHAEAMHRRFPNLNLSWLLFGEGEMFLSDESGSQGEGNVSDDAGTNVNRTSDTLFPEYDTPGSVNSLKSQNTSPNNPANASGTAYSHNVRAREANRNANGVPSEHPSVLNSFDSEREAFMDALQAEMEFAKLHNIKRRKITEIRIFFDDGTFETFKGN